ncbi:MAG TPA: cytochrome D1 domain-containing protein [Vicinamibacteria bacterium]
MRRKRAIVLAGLVAIAGATAPWARAAGSDGLLLVVNKGDHTLGIIDPVAGKMIAAVRQSGVTGHEVVASPDGRTAYVPIYGDSGVGRPGSDGRTMDVIDIASRTRVATVDFGAPQRPHQALFGPDGRLYLTAEATNAILVIDPRSNAVMDTLPTSQPESHMLALSRDGKTAYTSNVGAGTVSVIDVAARAVSAIVVVATRAQRLALSADGRFLFTADQDAPRLAVIDTRTNAVVRSVPLPGVAYGTAPTPDGRTLVMALPGVRKVGFLDLSSMEVVKTVDVPKAPQEVLVRPDGRVAYVSCDASGQVAEIDLDLMKVARLIAAGPMADGLAWAAQP